jgi:hypothetical protein
MKNESRINSQNQRLLQYLESGKRIHVFSPAKQKLRIGYLNSRVSDLVKKEIPIQKKRIQVKDITGELVSVVEYSIQKD